MNINSIIKFAFYFLLDSDRKPIFAMLKDIRALKSQYNYNRISHYFTCLMYKKNSGKVNDYLSREELVTIPEKFHLHNGYHSVLSNKIAFRMYLQKKGLPIVKFLGEIKHNTIISDSGELIPLTDKLSVQSVVNKWLEKHGSIFIKQASGLGGKGIFKFERGQSINISLLTRHEAYIIEVGIIQHNLLNNINPNSVNTLRVSTFFNHGKVVMLSSFLKMGTGNSFVDNGAMGGMFVNYDIQKNELGEVAYQLPKCGGRSFFQHPNTGFVFKGCSLPYPAAIINLVTEAALAFPDKEIIGWDIAYTNDGPVIVEGNNNPDLTMTQICAKGIKNNPDFKLAYDLQ
ncbi:sugar-transfer associated ATP-grasp domain-containing protein [Emticicia sp. TH156]|uniref:sugar-transfer associated ATP-grasp domain-containing protein n=1 Tax=Emticicia sp. TH156 TaxID=2067454 RepID=UPI000C780FA5|nr:sugar-transfer associated ATP-grasp domain-containing protein [Emticicia sp. TH156]PLK42247.1 hypothetical protein C0V77_21780 [Emticicia sp. TH156]